MLRNLLPFPTCPELGKRVGWSQTKSQSAASNLRTPSDVPPLNAVHQSLRDSMTMHKRKPWHMETDQRSQLQLLLPSGQDYQHRFSTLTPSASRSPAQAQVLLSELTLSTLATVEFVVTLRKGMTDCKLAVVGSHKKLGFWHAKKGLSLKNCQSGRLSARVTLDAGIYEFKVAGLSDGNVIWETGKNRSFQVPDSAHTGNDNILVVNCQWDDTSITAIDLQQRDTALLEPGVQLDSVREMESEVPRTLEGHIDKSAFQGKLDHTNKYLASLMHKQMILQERMQRLWRMTLEQEQLYDSLLARMPSDIYQLTVSAASAATTIPSTPTPPFSSPPTSPPPPFSPLPPFPNSTKHRTSYSHQHTRKDIGASTTFDGSSQLATSLQIQASAAVQATVAAHPTAVAHWTAAAEKVTDTNMHVGDAAIPRNLTSYLYLPAPAPFSPPPPSGTSSFANPPASQPTSTTPFPLGKDRKHRAHTELVIELEPLMFSFPASESENARHSAVCNVNHNGSTGDLSWSGSAVAELSKAQLSDASVDPANEAAEAGKVYANAGNVDTVDFCMCLDESRSEMLVVELPPLMFTFDPDYCGVDTTVPLNAAGASNSCDLDVTTPLNAAGAANKYTAGTPKIELTEENNISEPSSPAFSAWLNDATYDAPIQMTALEVAKDVADSSANPRNNQPFGLEPITFSFLPDGSCDIVFPEEATVSPEAACTRDDCSSLVENEASNAFVESEHEAGKGDVVASVSQLGLVPVMETAALSWDTLELNSDDGLLGCVGLGEYTSRVLQNLQEELERGPWFLLPAGADLDWLSPSSPQLDPLHTAVAVAESVLSTGSTINPLDPQHASASTTTHPNVKRSSTDNPQSDDEVSIVNKPYEASFSSATMVLAGLLLVNAPSTSSLNLASGQSSTCNTPGFEAKMDPPKFSTLVENQLGTSGLKTVFDSSVFEQMSEQMSESMQEDQLETSGFDSEQMSGNMQEDRLETSGFEPELYAFGSGTAVGVDVDAQVPGAHSWLRQEGILREDQLAAQDADAASNFDHTKQAVFGNAEEEQIKSLKRDGGTGQLQEEEVTFVQLQEEEVAFEQLQGITDSGMMVQDGVIRMMEQDVQALYAAVEVSALPSTEISAGVETTVVWHDSRSDELDGVWNDDVLTEDAAKDDLLAENEDAIDGLLAEIEDAIDDLLAGNEDVLPSVGADFIASLGSMYLEPNPSQVWPEDVQGSLPAVFDLNEHEYVMPSEAAFTDWQDSILAQFSASDTDYVATFSESATTAWRQDGLPAEFTLNEGDYVDEATAGDWQCSLPMEFTLNEGDYVDEATAGNWQDGLPEEFTLQESDFVASYDASGPSHGHTGWPAEYAVDELQYMPEPDAEAGSITSDVTAYGVEDAEPQFEQYSVSSAMVPELMALEQAAVLKGTADTLPTFGMALTGMLSDGAVQGYVSAYLPPVGMEYTSSNSVTVNDTGASSAQDFVMVFDSEQASERMLHFTSEQASATPVTIPNHAANSSPISNLGCMENTISDIANTIPINNTPTNSAWFATVTDTVAQPTVPVSAVSAASESSDTAIAAVSDAAYIPSVASDSSYMTSNASPAGVADAGATVSDAAAVPDTEAVCGDGSGDTSADNVSAARAEFVQDMWDVLFPPAVVEPDEVYSANLFDDNDAGNGLFDSSGDASVDADWNQFSWLGSMSTDAVVFELDRVGSEVVYDAGSDVVVVDVFGDDAMLIQQPQMQARGDLEVSIWGVSVTQNAKEVASGSAPCTSWPMVMETMLLQNSAELALSQLELALEVPTSANGGTMVDGTKSIRSFDLGLTAADAVQVDDANCINAVEQRQHAAPSPSKADSRDSSPGIISIPQWNDLVSALMQSLQSSKEQEQARTAFHDWLMHQPQSKTWPSEAGPKSQKSQKVGVPVPAAKLWKELAQPVSESLQERKLAMVAQLSQMQQQIQEAMQHVSVWNENQQEQLREVSASQLEQMQQNLSEALQSVSEWNALQQKQFSEVSASQLTQMEQLIHDGLQSASEWREDQRQMSAAQLDQMQQQLDDVLQSVSEWKELQQQQLRDVLPTAAQLQVQQQLQEALQCVVEWQELQQQQLHKLSALKLIQVQQQFQETLQSISTGQEMQHQQLREVSTSQLNHMEQRLRQVWHSMSEWKGMQQQQFGKLLPTAVQLSRTQELVQQAVQSTSEWKELQQQQLREVSALQQDRMQQEFAVRLQSITKWNKSDQQTLKSSLSQFLGGKEDPLMQAGGQHSTFQDNWNLEPGAGTDIATVPVGTTSGLSDSTEICKSGDAMACNMGVLDETPADVGGTDLSALTPAQLAQMEALLESVACFAALYQQSQAFQDEIAGKKDPVQSLRVTV